MDEVTKLISALAWPVTVLVLLLIFRRPLITILGLIGSVEVPGVAKILLDRRKVEKIIEEGAKKNVPAKQLADQIVKSAEDDLERRILRALFNEEDGRLITNYERYYPRPLRSLMDKGYVEKKDKKYFLTPSGLEATQTYLVNALTRQGALS